MSHRSTPGSEPICDARTLDLPRMLALGLQRPFAMFGVTVLVSILVWGYGLSLSIQTILFLTGIGTLFFHIYTHLEVSTLLDPSLTYLGGFSAVTALSSGACATMEPSAELQYACGDIVMAGLLYVILAVVIKLVGVKKAMRSLPPVVTGFITIPVGPNLVPNVVSNVSFCWWPTLLSIAVIVVANIWGKGMVRIIPILLGVVIPYLVAMVANTLGATTVDTSGSIIPLVDFSAMAAAVPIGLQPFFTGLTGSIAGFDVTPILVMAPVAVTVTMEHIGDMSAISTTVGENFLKRPGLYRTLIGDGTATSLTGLFGGPVNTAYGENAGMLMPSRVYDPKVVRLAAVYVVVLSFSPVFTALANLIPTVIIGGISFILYGMISAIGMRNVMENRVDFTNPRNLITAAVILVCGLGFSGGITFLVDDAHVTLTDLVIATITGIALNTILPGKDYGSGSDITEGRSGDFGRY